MSPDKQMSALVAEAGQVKLCEVPMPRLHSNEDVLLRVAVAGICRTDAYVAKGEIVAKGAVTLGHEFSAVVVAHGSEVGSLCVGDCVAVNPQCSCGTCPGCETGTGCFRPTTLGIHRHGCFAEYVVLPAKMVLKVPRTMSVFEAAYVEPVAACLAMFNGDINASQRGVLAGSSRFSRLAAMLLAHRGFDCISLVDGLAECSMDYAIETGLDSQELGELVRVLRPGGTLVLKSRSPSFLPLPARDLVLKDLRVQGGSYGSFIEAIDLLASGNISLPDTLIRRTSLVAYTSALLGEGGNEQRKAFFVVAGDGQWPLCAD